MTTIPESTWEEARAVAKTILRAAEACSCDQCVGSAVEATAHALHRARQEATEKAEQVKPLEWEDADEGMCTKWRAAALGGSYDIVAFEGEDGFAVNFYWGRPLSYWFIQGEKDEWGYPTGPKMFPSLDEAKTAAQADFERRALSALADASHE